RALLLEARPRRASAPSRKEIVWRSRDIRRTFLLEALQACWPAAGESWCADAGIQKRRYRVNRSLLWSHHSLRNRPCKFFILTVGRHSAPDYCRADSKPFRAELNRVTTARLILSVRYPAERCISLAIPGVRADLRRLVRLASGFPIR